MHCCLSSLCASGASIWSKFDSALNRVALGKSDTLRESYSVFRSCWGCCRCCPHTHARKNHLRACDGQLCRVLALALLSWCASSSLEVVRRHDSAFWLVSLILFGALTCCLVEIPDTRTAWQQFKCIFIFQIFEFAKMAKPWTASFQLIRLFWWDSWVPSC